MDCEQCQSQLLDLVEEDLSPGEAEEARAHVAACASCSEAFERLQRGAELAAFMPVEEPAPGLEVPILKAARAKAAGAAPEPEEARTSQPGAAGGGRWAAFLEWLRGLTLGPQVAMASVMLLVVAIGLWYLPDLRTRPGVGTGPVIHPEERPEAAAPSAETAADLEAPAGPAGEADRMAEAEAPAEEAEPEAAPEPAPARQKKARRRRQRSQAMARGEPAPSEQRAASRKQAASGADDALQGLAQDRAGGGAPTQRAAPAPQASQRQEAAEEGLAPMAMEQQQAPAPAGTDRLRRARAQRSAGRCREAVGTYRQFLGEAPRHPQRGSAMLELAGCYRTLGRTDLARHWLRKAMKEPGTAVAARRHMRQLDAADDGAAAQEPAASEVEAE